jgi:hypothetical protein
MSCESGACVSCATAMPCTGVYTTCDPSDSTCELCLAGSCPSYLPVCGPSGCAECTSDANCSGSKPKCFEGWCVGCVSSAECAAGLYCLGGICRPTCTDSSQCPPSSPLCGANGICIECRSTEDCPEPNLCYRNTCRPPLAGDACRNAIPLQLQGGSAEVRGAISLAYLADTPIHYSPSEQKRDIYYEVIVASELYLNADLRIESLGGTVATVAFMKGSCGQLVQMATATSTLRDVFVTPGTYYVRVTTHNAYLYTPVPLFTLKVFTSPATREVGNHCLKPRMLDELGALGGSSSVVTSDTTGLFPVEPDTCEGSTPDQVYGFTLQQRSNVLAAIQPLDAQGIYDLGLGKGDCFLLSTQCGLPNWAWRDFGRQEPGTYFVHVGTRATPGPYELRIEITPWATNTTCASAETLTFTQGVAVTQGDTRYTDLTFGACGYSDRGLHYKFSTVGMGPRSAIIRVSPESGYPTLSVSRGCPDGGTSTQVGCGYSYPAPGGGGTRDLPYLDEAEYGIQLVSISEGPFSMEVALGPPFSPPGNDNCTSGAEAVSVIDNSFSASGDTRGADDTIQDDCNGSYQPGGSITRDVVYRVPATRGLLSVTLQPTMTGYNPTLHYSTGFTADCASSRTSTDCVDATAAGQSESFQLVLERELYIWVDGAPGSTGTFTLSGTLTPPPTEDNCAMAAVLPSGGTPVSGSLAIAGDDPFSAAGCSSWSGPDVFYTFTAAANGTETITLLPNGFDGTLSVITNCSSGAACIGDADSAGIGGQETVTFSASRNAYIVVVQSRSSLRGPFTISRTGP